MNNTIQTSTDKHAEMRAKSIKHFDQFIMPQLILNDQYDDEFKYEEMITLMAAVIFGADMYKEICRSLAQAYADSCEEVD